MAVPDNKYLTFQLADESYAIPILKIREIIGLMAITRVPSLPNFIRGVINLRGKIISVIDLRLKFGLDERSYDERTSIIVMELKAEKGTRVIGIVVDAVKEVMDMDSDNIEPPPENGSEIDRSFLLGMGKVDEQVIMIVDVDAIISNDQENRQNEAR